LNKDYKLFTAEIAENAEKKINNLRVLSELRGWYDRYNFLT